MTKQLNPKAIEILRNRMSEEVDYSKMTIDSLRDEFDKKKSIVNKGRSVKIDIHPMEINNRNIYEYMNKWLDRIIAKKHGKQI